MISEVKCCDNMEYMAHFPDKFFDLGLIDPPYGSGIMAKNKFQRHKTTDSSYRNKSIPSHEFYKELDRICVNTIIWGCQYQIPYLNPNGSFIIWDKGADPDLHNMSSQDVAWYSKRDRIRTYRGRWCGAVKCESEPTIHIHQKPVGLYRWQLKNYAKPGFKIIDTNLGSQASRIAAYIEGYDFWGCEIDPKHFKDGCNRFNLHKQQATLF